MNTASPTPSALSNVGLVAEREIRSKIESKAFLISTLSLFVIVLAAVLWGGFAAQGAADEKMPVAVTGEAAGFLAGHEGLELTTVDSREEAEKLVTSDAVDAAVVPDEASPTGFTILAKTSAPTSLTMQLSVVPTVEILEPSTTDPALRYLVAIGFGVLFLMSAQVFGTTIATSVVEEKQTRVVEILLSSMSSRALLAGKVIGNTVLAMAQIIGLVAIAVIGLTITGQTEALAMLGAPMVWFAIFFLFGFVLLAALFAAGAAMVSRQEDIGSTTFPLTMLIMAPYMLVIFFNDNPTVLAVMSYVPFSAPVGMPMRLFLGDAAWWEPLLSLVILLVSCVVAILIAARIYDNSLLKMGSRVSWRDALSR